MGLVRTQEPAVEPLTVDEVKSYLTLDDDLTADDALIGMLITGVRQHVEEYTHRTLITSKWRLTLDSLCDLPCNVLRLENSPVQSVDSIVYLDMNGVQQTITAPGLPQYALDLSGSVPRIAPGFGQVWPITLPQIGAVQVNYTAGFGADATAVPKPILNWMLLRIGSLYENRADVVVAQRVVVQAMPLFDRMLDPYTVELFA
jgi:uncharacterized phiE125 gp8 family phage protein